MKSAILFAVLVSINCAVYGARIPQILKAETKACPVDDPLTIEEGSFNITLNPLIIIDVGSKQGGGVATGLTSLFRESTFDLVSTTLNFHVKVDYADATGIDYSATGMIDSGPISADILPSGPFTASGNYKGGVAKFEVKGTAVFFVNLITNRISCRVLEIETFSVAELAINLGNVVIGGQAVDWVVWNDNIIANIERDWNANRPTIIEHIRVSANEKLKDYTLQDLIDFIDDEPCEP